MQNLLVYTFIECPLYSTKIRVPKSGDFHLQKSSFFKGDHKITRESITDVTGRVLYWGKSAVAISPASGDSRLSGFALKCELFQAEKKLALDTGLSILLKGTEKYFVVLVGKQSFMSENLLVAFGHLRTSK